MSGSIFFKRLFSISLLFTFALFSFSLFSAKAANARSVFPGAGGFGTDTKAAYQASNAPVICIVNTLDYEGKISDSTRNGLPVKVGSLKALVEWNQPSNTGKVILFEVSGTITGAGGDFGINLKSPYTSILGQTAPSPGITLKNIMFSVQSHDILIQHIRSRLGDIQPGPDPGKSSNFEINANVSNVYNVVLDHVSVSWAVDNNVGIGEEGSYSAHDITISNTIISEPLFDSIHPKGPHSKGLASSRGPSNISIVKNLFAHSDDRSPLLADSSAIISANNLFYNCMYGNRIWTDNSPIKAIIENNVNLGGSRAGGYGCVKDEDIKMLYLTDPVNYFSSSKIFMNGNTCMNYSQSSASDWSSVYKHSAVPDISKFKTTTRPFPLPNSLKLMNSGEVKSYVLTNVGARPLDRDSVDKRIINEVINKNGHEIDSQYDVGGWPSLAKNTHMLSLPSNPHKDDDSNGYTNLEDYIFSFTKKVESESTIEPPVLSVVNVGN